MKQEFNKSGEFSIVLTKSDLKQIYLLITESSKKFNFIINCRVANLTLKAENFDEFINSEDSPEKFDYLSISASVYAKSQMEKWVDITSYSNTRLSVVGNNETWVLGLFNKLSDIFTLLEQQRRHLLEANNFTSKKNYQKTGNIKPCILTKNDVIDLINLMQDDTSGRELSRLTLYSDLPNIRIEANNIHQFFEQAGLPQRLVDFTAYISGKDDIFIHVSLDAFIPTITVKGNNEIWVMGKYAQLIDFLNKRKVWYWFVHRPFGLIAIGLATISIFSLINAIEMLDAFRIVLASTSTIAWILAIVFNFRGSLLPATYIDLSPKRQRINKEDVSLVIALLTLVLYLYEIFLK